ncbi:hypothetical protein EAE96_008619 [Botrytis aclada]|nr:hypothetical protein EAE96_008619 [Botrytis aclada]
MLKTHHDQTAFLAVLCRWYGREAGTSPLSLVHLRLGSCILLECTPDSDPKMIFTSERVEKLDHNYLSNISSFIRKVRRRQILKPKTYCSALCKNVICGLFFTRVYSNRLLGVCSQAS